MSEEKVVKLGAKREKKQENEKQDDLVYCSFCNRPNTQVIKMVKGPGVNICSECAMIAVQYLILNDRMPSAEAQQILDSATTEANDYRTRAVEYTDNILSNVQSILSTGMDSFESAQDTLMTSLNS